jgi:phenylacetate-coenzyme A ligase PaaK-like adenylate-forming protein
LIPGFLASYLRVAVAENQPSDQNRMRELISDIRTFISAPTPDAGRFYDLARRLCAIQYERNAAYRAFCDARGVTPEKVGEVAQIPAIPTAAFKELELTLLSGTERSRVFLSSGTTEQRRSRHFHSDETLRLYEHSLLSWFEPHVCVDRSKFYFLVLGPEAGDAPNSSLVHMFETVSKRFGASVVFAGKVARDGSWILDHELIDAAELRFRDLPVVICGTAFSFVHLCDHLAETGRTLKFPEGSRVFETGGYKGRSREVTKVELHRLITERLSVEGKNIVTEYGMSELSSQAYDRIAGQSGERIFHFPHWARATVISAETGVEVKEGEIGLLRIVDLANVGSVCSVQTEDLAIRRGAGFELLGRAELAEPRGCSLMQVHS